MTTIGRQVGSVLGVAETSTKITGGQARSAAGRTIEVAADATKQTVGQARAEAVQQTIDVGADAAEQLLDSGVRAADPDRAGEGVSFDEWTKAELYDRAQELDIEGRSAMSKGQLVSALRSA